MEEIESKEANAPSRLMTIAEHCPVHRTLTSEINIRTRLT